MRYFQKLPGRVDPTLINTQLEAHPELWNQFTVRKTAPQSPHTAMSDIWVRYNDIRPFTAAGNFSTFNDPHIPIWYPAWRVIPALRPVVFGLMNALEGEMLGGILITRIPPGGKIAPHTDAGWHVDYYDKFYVHLQANPSAAFFCGDEVIRPEAGDVYRFDNRREHWVTNEGATDRVTLIVCIRTEMFRGAV